MGFSRISACAACGAKNRVPAKHLTHQGRCGVCQAALPPLDSPLGVDEAAFYDIVRSSTAPVLVDFWAAWCGPCRMVAPEVAELAKEMAGRAVVLKVNTEEHPALATRYGVQSIPHFVVLRDGKITSQRSGAVPRSELKRWIEQSGD